MRPYYNPENDGGTVSPPFFVRVTFKANRRALFCNQDGLPIKDGDYVIVETPNGEDLGQVTFSPCGSCGANGGNGQEKESEDSELGRILRKATDQDLAQLHANRKAEGEAFQRCLPLIERHGLRMKLVDVEYQFDRRKLTFYYVAEERVDFRQLVKDLARTFRTRIEMRQIGVRDYAKRLGGIGPCGQELCCARFMDSFQSIATQLAKDQNLPINPSKLSGACGKLKCCLRFEWDFYQEARQKFPDLGVPLELEQGVALITSHDFLRDQVIVTFENGTTQTLSLAAVKRTLRAMQRTSNRMQRKNS